MQFVIALDNCPLHACIFSARSKKKLLPKVKPQSKIASSALLHSSYHSFPHPGRGSAGGGGQGGVERLQFSVWGEESRFFFRHLPIGEVGLDQCERFHVHLRGLMLLETM